MESGNSDSFQSSTGDEELDSHGDGINSVFMMNNNQGEARVISSFANQQWQPLQLQSSSSSQLPPCNTVSSDMYGHRLMQPQPLPPLQLVENRSRSFLDSYVLDWSNAKRSEINSRVMMNSDLGSNQAQDHGSADSKPPSMSENTRVSLHEPPPPPAQEARKPRKRSRVSRGAATTVLTTDTTNFRAMVQEFTGIPEPPFPSHFQRTRLDIFGTAVAPSSSPYLQIPFPQKVNLITSPPPPPLMSSSSFFGSSSFLDHAINNHQFAPQNSSFFNLPNQFLPSLIPKSNSSILSRAKPHQESRVFSSSMLNPQTGLLPNLITSDQRTSRINNDDATRWGNGMGSSQDDDDDQSHVIITSANM